MSLLGVVVSDGSPGSWLDFASVAPLETDDVRARLAAGTAPPVAAGADVFGCCCLPGDGIAEPVDSSPPSSPEASRDEGCRKSGLGTCTDKVWDALRLRLPEAEIGDDMVA